MASARIFHSLYETSASFAKRRTWLFTGIAVSLLLLFGFGFGSHSSLRRSPSLVLPNHRDGDRTEGGSRKPNTSFDGTWNYKRDAKNLLLDEGQCEAAFPGLFVEPKRAEDDRKGKKITIKELDDIEPLTGYVRAMIYDQQIYVISTQGLFYSRTYAILQALYRALTTSPTPLPNIEFTFCVDDKISPKAQWALTRREDEKSIWLMPDYGYWSWPEPHVGAYSEVQLKTSLMESFEGYSWAKKTDKLLWRGALMDLPTRKRLIEVTKDKPWADVKELHWHDKESTDADLKTIEEHCTYRYLMHVEGNSYSGRLKYLQNCASVIIAPPLKWIQHHHHLMSHTGPEQNFVQVDDRMDELQATIDYLRNNPERAEAVARKNVEIFRERYLTPAAEVCYWRALVRSWARVSFEPELWEEKGGKRVLRGVPVESYLLERRLEWDPY